MDEVLLLLSRAALVATGAGGSAMVVTAAARRRIAWVPASAATVVLLGFAAPVLLSEESPPGVYGVIGFTWFVGFPLLAATFPTGRFVPRWSAAVVGASLALEVADIATGFALRDAAWWGLVGPVQLIAAAGFVIWRYRRSAVTIERERLRWILLGVVLTATAFMLVLVVDGTIGGTSAAASAVANLAGVPLAVTLVIACAWPRLWNVDVALRAVLVADTAGWAMGGVFAGTTTIAQLAGASDVRAAGWGAAAVAITAFPAVRLASRGATWLVFRDRLPPERAAALLGSALEQDSSEPIAARIVRVAAHAIGASTVRLAAVSRHDSDVFDSRAGGAESGIEPPHVVPVSFHGEQLATLTVTPRRGESELSPRDVASLTAIARHAGPALDGARALRAARQAQSELVFAREEERRRLRRDLHDDLGPTLTGLALSAAAIARRAEPLDPAVARAARELSEGIAEAVDRSREIAHGLRPAVLDDHGLATALRERLGDTPDLQLDIAEIDDLSAAVSLAALRIVQEAVTNTRRHADASLCRVTVAPAEDGIRIDVDDDGVGLPRSPNPGVGLRSIRERAAELGGHAQIGRSSIGGTRVSVWLPNAEPTGAAP